MLKNLIRKWMGYEDLLGEQIRFGFEITAIKDSIQELNQKIEKLRSAIMLLSKP